MKFREERLLAAAVIDTYITKSGKFSATLIGTPGIDTAVLSSLGRRVIRAISAIYGVKDDPIANTRFIGSFYTIFSGTIIIKALFSMIPAVGPVTNAITSSHLSRNIGWSAVDCIERYGKLGHVDSADKRRVKILAHEMEKLYLKEMSRLPEPQKKQVMEAAMSIIDTKDDDTIDEKILTLRSLFLGSPNKAANK